MRIVSDTVMAGERRLCIRSCLVLSRGKLPAPRYGRLSSHICLSDPGNFSIPTELLTYRGRFSSITQEIFSKPVLQ
jgi:hypothetical protein